MRAQIKPRIDLLGRTKLETVIPLSVPFIINVDPADTCNFQCKFCPTGDRALMKKIPGRNHGTMDFELYKKIIDDICEFDKPIKVLRLYKDGEPLLNLRMAEMIRYAKEKRCAERIDTTTNAVLLNPKKNTELIAAGLDRINISIEGINAQQYRKFSKCKVDFEKLIEDIRHLYENKKQCEIIVKINGDILSEDDKQKFYEIFGDIADEVYIEHIMACWPEFKLKDVEVNQEYGIYGQKIKVVFVSGGMSRVADITPKAHKGFNVGYIGTVDFCKMHPDFVKMSSSIKIPEVNFIVCGGGMEDILRKQALELAAEERFEFKGFVENISPILEILDVFGYPLCKEHYGTGEQALLEAMGAGVPPVVFSHGAEKYIIENNKTGLIVDNETEYIDAIEYLYKNPQERMRLGSDAREYAKNHLSVEKTAKKFNEIYDELLLKPKRRRSFKKRFLPAKNISGCSYSVGSDVFISSLGDSAEEFIVSVTSENIDELFKAEEKIANCAPAMKAETRGSVFHYSKVFPDDVCLKFWAGLILQKQGNHKDAIQHFRTVYNMGWNHWRVLWYLAKSANEIEEFAIAKKALKNVIKAYPAFSDAKDILNNITMR